MGVSRCGCVFDVVFCLFGWSVGRKSSILATFKIFNSGKQLKMAWVLWDFGLENPGIAEVVFVVFLQQFSLGLIFGYLGV